MLIIVIIVIAAIILINIIDVMAVVRSWWCHQIASRVVRILLKLWGVVALA